MGRRPPPDVSDRRSASPAAKKEAPVKVLFVCLSNICRSPLAEGIFLDLIAREGLCGKVEAGSAGTSDYFLGESPDERVQEVASRKGLQLSGTARQVSRQDFERNDLVLAMDAENYHQLWFKCPPEHRRKIVMLRRYEDAECPPDVPDPYYGGQEGFAEVYDILDRNCRALLEQVRDAL